MISAPYLDLLDAALRPGLAGLSEPFVAAQAGFVAGCQRPDGGFGGRQGGSDLYYLDFALRTLAWLAPEHAAFERAADYLACRTPTPRDTVECFNLLNARRLLERRVALALPVQPSSTADTGTGIASGTRDNSQPSCRQSLIARLGQCVLPGGGFARFAGDPRASAYHTFLGSLCYQMLGAEMSAVRDSIRAIESLRRPDGGYAELAGQAGSQTSATAAALGFLTLHDATPADTADSVQFLAAMQSQDGGLRPHTEVAGGDLLSTFTGLTTLWGLGGLDRIDLAGVARFLRDAACPGGGFLACAADDTPDAEYTYYGVATLALLRVLEG